MSIRKYLEIDSSYRNRNQYSNPSNFILPISQFTLKAANAYDSVCNSSPIQTWIPDDLILLGGTIHAQPLNTRETFFLSLPSIPEGIKISGYFAGFPIQVDNLPGETVKISNWEFFSSSDTFDCFIVSISEPFFSAIPEGDVTFLPNTSNFTIGTFYVPSGVIADNYYSNCIFYNETLNSHRQISNYDGKHKVIGLNLKEKHGGALVGWSPGHTYSLRKEPPSYFGTLPGPLTHIFNKFFVDPNTPLFIADFIRFTASNKSYKVTGYTGSTGTTPHLVTIQGSVDTAFAIGDTFEVLRFSRENSTPLAYNGSTVSHQSMVSHEIELISLILPNKTLISGGKVSFYPYVYIELQNISNVNGGTHIAIYSNNPNSSRILFRASINDLGRSDYSPFLKINGNGIVQTVHFKPSDDLKFGVYLPDGTLFQTIENDLHSPNSPNPLLQISAVFSIKRL